MEVSGKVKTILEQQTFGSGFTKRELVLTTEEQYPQHLLIEFVQEKVALLSDLNVNDKITVNINLRGREWQAPDGTIKYFNSIQGWRINKTTEQQNTTIPTAPLPTSEDFGGNDNTTLKEDIDDLPF